MPDIVTRTSPTLSSAGRKLSLGALILALIALAFALFQRAYGNAVSWTAVAVPLLLTVNAGVLLLGLGNRYPRATKGYWLCSCAFAILMIVTVFSRVVR
jgi:hypothetical protein